MRILLAVLMTMISGMAYGQYANLDKFSLKIMRFSCNREVLTPDIACKQYRGRVATEFDLSLFEYGFWRNEVHAEGTMAKFMTVGWHYQMGIKLGQFELFHEHHSRHVMDQGLPSYFDTRDGSVREMRFPVEDSYGVRIVFYERKK